MHTSIKAARYLVLLLLVMAMQGCVNYVGHQFKQNYKDPQGLVKAHPATSLKAHMKDGDLYLFNGKWSFDSSQSLIRGKAIHYNVHREAVADKFVDLPVGDVALFETNQILPSKDAGRVAALMALTIADGAMALFCISNPKACWGSCPTFYYKNEGNVLYSNAEGFSASILPSLEEGDIDALNNDSHTGPGQFMLTMKNEALETHAVNEVKLYAAPRRPGSRVFHTTDDKFYASSTATAPVMAIADGKDVTSKMAGIDQQEYFSVTDSNDFNTKETIELTFDNAADGNKGVVINFRQTLVTTFLFYSALGYMGDDAGAILARIDGSTLLRNRLRNMMEHLGGIDAQVYNERSGKWVSAGTVFESGPIAKNLQMLKLPAFCSDQRTVKVKLRVSKGYWRIDYAALASGIEEVKPIEIHPSSVSKNGEVSESAYNSLAKDDADYLLSMPGDCFKMAYELPEAHTDYELFVYSKGYYLEWLRPEWMAQKNIDKLMDMVNFQPETWKSLAREFKQGEASGELSFWSSKVTTK